MVSVGFAAVALLNKKALHIVADQNRRFVYPARWALLEMPAVFLAAHWAAFKPDLGLTFHDWPFSSSGFSWMLPITVQSHSSSL